VRHELFDRNPPWFVLKRLFPSKEVISFSRSTLSEILVRWEVRIPPQAVYGFRKG